MKLILTRKSKLELITLGELEVWDESTDTGKPLYKCYTIELPWKDNKSRVSCIPAGIYGVVTCKRSPHIQYEHYDILDVPNRDGIKIHIANYVRSLLGCVAVGKYQVDLDKDGIMDVAQSKQALTELMKVAGDSFKLEIKWSEDIIF